MGKELEVDVISDGTDVLIPASCSTSNVPASTPATPSPCTRPFPSGTRCSRPSWTDSESWPCPSRPGGLSNIQYLIYQGELYVIEVNAPASRTVPYISKVTGVPMVDLATRVMVGHALKAWAMAQACTNVRPTWR